MSPQPLSAEQVRRLPPVLDPAAAGHLLGIGRTTTYALLAAGTFPVPAFRAGRRWRIPTAGVCRLLGLDYPPATGIDAQEEDHDGQAP